MRPFVFFGPGEILKPHYGERIKHLILVGSGLNNTERRYVREALLCRLEPDALIHVYSIGVDSWHYRTEYVGDPYLPELEDKP